MSSLFQLCTSSALMLLAPSENQNHVSRLVNRPIAEAEVPIQIGYSQLKDRILEFSRREGFAVQETVKRPRGNVEFSIRLFRDDVSITTTRLQGGPVLLSAFPLCVCEIDKRAGLREAARAAVSDLEREMNAR